MKYAWTSKIYLNSKRAKQIPVQWVLTENGEIRATALISKRRNTKTYWPDSESLGPVVASLGEFEYGVRPNVPVEMLAVILYIWENTKDEFPDQEIKLTTNNCFKLVDATLHLTSAGVLIFTWPDRVVTGLSDPKPVIIRGKRFSFGKNQTFELSDPLSFPQLARLWQQYLQWKTKPIEELKRRQLWWSIAKLLIGLMVLISVSLLLPESFLWVGVSITMFLLGFWINGRWKSI